MTFLSRGVLQFLFNSIVTLHSIYSVNLYMTQMVLWDVCCSNLHWMYSVFLALKNVTFIDWTGKQLLHYILLGAAFVEWRAFRRTIVCINDLNRNWNEHCRIHFVHGWLYIIPLKQWCHSPLNERYRSCRLYIAFIS